MDDLKSKKTKEYSYVSRYSGIPYYYNSKDKKYIYGISKQLDDTTSFILHNIEEVDTLDSLANYYYGRPDLFWVIADFNRIEDPFLNLNLLPKKSIKIPSISNISYKNTRE